MSLNIYVVTVGGAKSLVFGTTTPEEARDAVLRAQYPTEVAPATESDLASIPRVDLLALSGSGSVQIKNIGRLRKPAEPKYRHPENEKLTWTGRGRAPAWFQELLDKGHTKESLLIPGAVDGTDPEGDDAEGEVVEQNGDFI